MIHGVPTSFDMSWDGSDVNLGLIEDNSDIITHLSTLRNVKFLGPNGGQVSQKTHGSLILYFTDPIIANTCIDCQVVLHSGLLPSIKFASHPPHCFKCHHTGHIVCYCKAMSKCGMCGMTRETVQSRRGMDLLTNLPCQSARCVVGLTWCQILGSQLTGPLLTNAGLKLPRLVLSTQYTVRIYATCTAPPPLQDHPTITTIFSPLSLLIPHFSFFFPSTLSACARWVHKAPTCQRLGSCLREVCTQYIPPLPSCARPPLGVAGHLLD